MSSRRSVVDRLIKLVGPQLVRTFHPAPVELAPGIWVVDRRLRMPGGPVLPNRSTIVRLGDGGLVVLSPPALAGSEDSDAIDALGAVRHVVIPNSFHYVYAAPFLARYPKAVLLASAAFGDRVPEFASARELGSKPPAEWAGELDLAVLGPVQGISETVFFHRATGTLVLTDLAFHMVRFESVFDRIAWRASGVPAGFGPSRTARLLLLKDRAEASRFLRQVAGWPIERIVVAHGDAIDTNAKARFLEAFEAWL